ncbi:hypothetical protein [Cerasicoccus frondis]|uniref:hypothetical protein n=1 Tax=Cerasicoccus frondis TaxID=490090 RepID=UPI002852B85E|nr:hypothetical protein [Cerasicoccus frondis]
MTRFLLTAALAPLGLLALDPTPAELKQYNGAAFGAFPVEYPSTPSGQSNAIKQFGEYTLGDIDGELGHIQSLGVNQVKTYAHAIWAPVTQYDQGLQQYIEGWNSIVSSPTSTTATTALGTLNNPFDNWSFITAGTKWVIPMATARGMNVFATANVSSGTLASSPTGVPATVDIKYRVNGSVKTMSVTTSGLSLPGGYTTYTSAHWDVELAIAAIANDRLQLSQPTSSTGSYAVSTLSGQNRTYVDALIIGNEVLSTGGMTATQVQHMVKFAKDRRTAYGLTVAELPITTCTNSLGNWQSMQSNVLPEIETFIVFNTYGLQFTSVAGTNQASPSGLSTSNPAKSVSDQVIANIQAFQTWLSGTAQSGLTVVVGEHGYPSETAASDPNNLFSNTHAAQYYCGDSSLSYKGALSAIAEQKVLCFFFEAFDEPWKDLAHPTDGAENYWGVAIASQSARRAPSNPYDPSTYDVWTYPQTYAQKTDYCSPFIPAQTLDSDGDGLTDNFEAQIINFHSNDAIAGFADVQPDDDFDNDGLTESQEHRLGTSPVSQDSDNDLFDDLKEVNFGSDPNDPRSLPITQELDVVLEYRFVTQVGYIYQVQYAVDGEYWEDVDSPVVGDGEVQTVIISLEGRESGSDHYRLRVSLAD